MQAPVENCQRFADINHFVWDQFLEYFTTRGAIEIVGYPLTEAFFDVSPGVVGQYLQRSRLEYRPGNPIPMRCNGVP